MKTLYKITLALAVMLISGSSFAQTAQDQASTNLLINVQDVYTIQTGQNRVVIPMRTPLHFTEGSTSGEQEDHLRITATSEYSVNVQAASTDLTHTGGETIPVNSVQVSVTGLGTTGEGEASYGSDAPYLSDGAQYLLGVLNGVLDRAYNVEYAIPADRTVNFLNKTEGIYRTVVTYTLMAE